MAVPTDFRGSNTVLGRPATMTDDQCEALNVLRTITEDGFPVTISCWKVTAEELAEINKTGRIWLSVVGTTTPPVVVLGQCPFYQIQADQAETDV